MKLPSSALSMRVPQIAKRGFWCKSSCSKFNPVFGELGGGWGGHLPRGARVDLINRHPRSWGGDGAQWHLAELWFGCDRAPPLNEDKREPPTRTDSAGARVGIPRGSFAG